MQTCEVFEWEYVTESVRVIVWVEYVNVSMLVWVCGCEYDSVSMIVWVFEYK